MLGGVEMGLSGFPTFNSPQELGDAEAAAGIDVALAATNHALDKGFEGIEATLRFWRERHPEMLVPGIADSNEAADRPHIVTRGRIAVAILNYTETTNGIPMPAEHPYCVKSLYRSNFAADVSRAREAGADIVVACAHWGTEYVYEPNAVQRRLASRLIEAGVDAIIGTHPHVLQPVELMHRPDGRRVPVFWSLGNLISRQMEAPRTVGGLAGLTVEKIGDACAITSCSIQPTVMHKTSRSDTGMRVYRLADYSDELAGGNNVETTEDFPSFTVAGCHDFASKVLGASYDRASSSLLLEVNPL
ncbi:Capsule biosynthesis protein CapA [Collinsella intestinalis]|nr:Capsule biosynthesis protein CapA [Collinsella intestinalis]